MKVFIFIYLMAAFPIMAQNTELSCIDKQSIAIEGFCFDPDPQAVDYVYGDRNCYIQSEYNIAPKDLSDQGIYDATTQLRETQLLDGFIAGTLNFLPIHCFTRNMLNFCQGDPTGEMYSEITDAADLSIQLQIIGLNPIDYSQLIDSDGFGIGSWTDLDIEDIATIEASTNPQISQHLSNWKRTTCEKYGNRN